MRLHFCGILRRFILLTTVVILPVPGAEKAGKDAKSRVTESAVSATPVLWRDPADLTSLNLFFGPGGKQHEPQPPFTFVKEDLNGTNPKFVVSDRSGVKWTAKLGTEARPETAATRLVWAAGYFADEDYFLADMTVDGMPSHVKRGQNLVGPGGVLHNVRMKRHMAGREKAGIWKWRDNPFSGTRELDGLRVMMAVIDNWDLKDVNNVIYKEKHKPEPIYVVSDLGASFASANESFPLEHAKGNLEKYSGSKFIEKVTEDSVSFATPGRPSVMYAPALPRYMMRVKMGWIGKDIPRAHAKWMGELLSRLSPEQIRDAFRAAGYSVEEVETFATIVQRRISVLADL